MLQSPASATRAEFDVLFKLVNKVAAKQATLAEYQYLLEKLNPETLRLRPNDEEDEYNNQNLLYYVVSAAAQGAPQLYFEIWNKYNRDLTLNDFRRPSEAHPNSPSSLWLIANIGQTDPAICLSFIIRFRNELTVEDLKESVKGFGDEVTSVFGLLACDNQRKAFEMIWPRFDITFTTDILCAKTVSPNSLYKSPIDYIFQATLADHLSPHILQFCLEELGDLRPGLSQVNHVDLPSFKAEVIFNNLKNLQNYRNAFFDAVKVAQISRVFNTADLENAAQITTDAGYHAAFAFLSRFYNEMGRPDLAAPLIMKISVQSKLYDHIHKHAADTYLLRAYTPNGEVRKHYLEKALQSALRLKNRNDRYHFVQKIAYCYFMDGQVLPPNMPGFLGTRFLEATDVIPSPSATWCLAKFEVLKPKVLEKLQAQQGKANPSISAAPLLTMAPQVIPSMAKRAANVSAMPIGRDEPSSPSIAANALLALTSKESPNNRPKR
jgi:hypothetical protein